MSSGLHVARRFRGLCLSPAVVAVLAMAATPAATHRTPGSVKEFRIPSKVYGKDRRIWVYRPASYKPTASDAYGLMIVFDGEDFQKDIPLPRILDSLSAARAIPPLVAVMIDNGSGAARLNDLANNPPFAAFLSGEVVPWVRQHFNVTRDPRRTTIAGSSAGGLGAAYLALVHPELFGNVLSLSGAFWRGYAASNDPPYEWLAGQYAAQPRRAVRFFMDVGALETHRALGTGPVFIDATRRFRDALRSKGYNVIYSEVPGGTHSPESWVRQLPAGIVALSR